MEPLAAFPQGLLTFEADLVVISGKHLSLKGLLGLECVEA